MTHENPFKGYAGHIALHKDFGKYIDFNRGKLGGNITFIKKLTNLKLFFWNKIKKNFVLRQTKKLFWKLKTK